MNIPSTLLNFLIWSHQNLIIIPHPANSLPLIPLMSDTLSHHMNPQTPFLHHFPYPSSTESESADDDLTGLTRSVSFHPLLQKKKVFSCSYPTTPFGQADDDSWDLIYAAAEQVAIMKTKMKMNALNDAVFANRCPLETPRPLSHHHEEFLRQQLFRRSINNGVNYYCTGRCAAGGPLGFRPPAWPPVSLESQRRQQPTNRSTVNPVSGYFKKERAGTGVFLPRNYPNISTEPKKKPGCLFTHMPAGVGQSLNKNMDPVIAPPQQQNVRNGFVPRCQVLPPPPQSFNRDELAELVTARRNAVRSATHAEVVLPQEWTY